MKVQIDTNLFLESDEHNFILRELKVSQSGRAKSKFKYFANLDGVLNHLFTRRVKQSKAQTLQQLLNEISAMKLEVKEKLRNVI